MEYEVGRLKLREATMQKQLRSAVELEKYQDEEEMKKVIAAVNEAKAKEQAIDEWKVSTEAKQKDFHTLVVNEFSKLGEELDLSELEMAKERASEQWAIAQQQKMLEGHLGDEIHDMSALADQRLAALAAQSGKEIAELLKNEELNDAERAKAISAIKNAARMRSQKIVEQDGQLKLDQQTAERNIKIATDEVSQSMGRIATLEGHRVSGSSVDHVMEKIKGLISQAHSNIAAHTSLVEEEGTEQLAEEVAGAHALEGQDPLAMLQRATQETEKMVSEDKDWKNQLRRLEVNA